MITYRIFAEDQQFIVKADGFEVHKDEGTIIFYNNETILGFKVNKCKACFVLNNIIGFSIVEAEIENE